MELEVQRQILDLNTDYTEDEGYSAWLSDECQNLLRFRPRILTPQQVLVSFRDSLTCVGGSGNETRQVQRLGMRITTQSYKIKDLFIRFEL